MDIKEVVKDLLSDYVKEHNLKIYDVDFLKEDNNYILRVLIDKNNDIIDIDTLSNINDYLSEKIDGYDKDLPEYFLEVSSPGAERVLKDEDEILASINKYIHVEVPNMIYEGYLLEVSDEEIVVKINIKGRIKNQKINRNEIKLIRLAVKF